MHPCQHLTTAGEEASVRGAMPTGKQTVWAQEEDEIDVTVEELLDAEDQAALPAGALQVAPDIAMGVPPEAVNVD